MQKGWDDLDKLIADSAPKIDVDDGYNYRLLSKINRHKHTKRSNYAAGFSLILAGLILMFIYTSSLEYKVIDMKYKIKIEFLMLRYNYSFDKYLLGE